MLRAVLDANVYISALLRPEGPPGRLVERFLREAAFEVVLTPAIVDEVLRAFGYPKVRKFIRGDVEPELWLEDILVLADLVAGEREVSGVGADPDDDQSTSPQRSRVGSFRRHGRPATPRGEGV